MTGVKVGAINLPMHTDRTATFSADPNAAHQGNPNGKWHVGTRFSIVNAPTKADLGLFEITHIFPQQSRECGQEYLWVRVGGDGRLLKSNKANLRGGSERMLTAHASIISE